MAIMDFFHCENIPDNVIKLYRFKKMLQQARLVGKDFEIPDIRKVGGKYFSIFILFCSCNNKSSFLNEGILLDINLNNTYKKIKSPY